MAIFAQAGRLTRARQLLVVLGLLCGILLMHGISSDHSMPMASVSMSDGPMSDGPMSEGPMSQGHAVIGSVAATGADDVPLDLVSAPLTAHSMGALCLAILGGAVLLLPMLVASLRVRRRGDAGLPPSTRLGLAQGATFTRWLEPPSLTGLCISRT